MFKKLSQIGHSVVSRQCNTSYKLAARQSTKRLLSSEVENAATEPVVKETYRPKQRKFGVGTALLCTIPFFTFGLGTWQVQRLRWKVNYISTLEDRLHREAIPLPRRINANVLEDYEYRKVYAKGHYRHDQEILLGPRTRGDGNAGYFVITPFERDNGTTILVKRGWISPDKKDQRTRPESLVTDEVEVVGLIRVNEERNTFTPDNDIRKNQWYWADVDTIAQIMNTQPVMIERVSDLSPSREYALIEKGIPVGRSPTVEVRNHHLNYLITWYSLSLATSVMLWRLLRKPPARPVKIKRV